MAKNLLRHRNKRAQGMTEYIIIVGLIAIAVIGAVKIFGTNVNEGFKASNDKISTAVIQNGIRGTGLKPGNSAAQ